MDLVVISQNVCPACRNLESYLNNEHPELEYTHINIDETPDAVEAYNVMGTPTFILVDEDKEEITRHTGFDFGPAKDILNEFIEQL